MILPFSSLVPLGSFGNPGISCKDIAERKSYPLGDGKYWIKPTGSEQFSVYCDMTTDGGKTKYFQVNK